MAQTRSKIRGRRRLASWIVGVALAVGLLSAVFTVRADGPITAETLQNPYGVVLDKDWRYRPGDDPAWAEPGYDEREWETLETPRLEPGAMPDSGWRGIGWFRKRFSVDESLVRRPLMMTVFHPGASEIYLDGKLLRENGVVSASSKIEETGNPAARPFTFEFDRAGEHLLAVRYSCLVTSENGGIVSAFVARQGIPAGFRLALRDPNVAVPAMISDIRASILVVTLYLGVLGSFALLHLLIFLFHRAEPANLYYSLFAFTFSLIIGLEALVNALGVGALAVAVANLVTLFALATVFVAFLMFLYSAFGLERPRYFRLIVGCWYGSAVLVSLVRGEALSVLIFVSIGISVAEASRIMGRALGMKLDGAWIIAIGVQGFGLALTAMLVRNFFPQTRPVMQPAMSVLFFVLPLCVSIYLARRFARTTETLQTKLVEVEELSARALEQERREAEIRLAHEQEQARKNAAELRAAAAELQVKAAEAQAKAIEAEHLRKTQELDEARDLQLSMLPKQLPSPPGLDIAVYMRTATEVGGDYYDFHTSEDGVLTIAVGDATGHGLKAGTLVATVKGLFGVLAHEPDIRGTFREVTRTLKGMQLGRLYMALTLAKVEGRRIRLSAAGMPPMLVFRAATGEVERVLLRGMPLGAFLEFKYETSEVALEAGDAVLLMSDGFPELFNPAGEMLDYDRAAEIFAEAATGSPDEIVEHLTRAAEAWTEGAAPDDDMTFVVLKVL